MSNQHQPLVYFFAKSSFGDDQPDFIKIGYTGQELSLRKAALQTGSESPIWAMGVLLFETEDEARREENRIHKHFGGFRAGGEWFYATPRVIQYIEDYAVQYTGRFTEDVPPTSGQEAVEPDVQPIRSEEVVEPDVQPIRSEESVKFGNWLRESRTERNMSADEVAKIAGCTTGYIYYIENGWGMPGTELHDALIRLFGDPADSTTETRFNNPLGVEMPDGTWISENTGIDTFIEVIKAIGIEKIKELDLSVNGIPLIADCDYDGKDQRKVETEAGTYYIVSGTDRGKKKRILDDIAARLNVDMAIFLNSSA